MKSDSIPYRLIFKAGVSLRNPRIFECLEFLRKSQTWSRTRLQERQDELLRSLVSWAYAKCPFYRERLENAGVAPHEIREVSDLHRIPPLEKSELLSERHRIQVPECGERLFYSETSGSTGNPLVFWRNASWDAWHNASVLRGYSWYQVSPWERNGYLWGYNFAPYTRLKTRALDVLQNRFRMFSYNEVEIRRFAEKLRNAAFLGGYSSMIYEVAKVINSNSNIEPLTNLKLVKGTSEKIFDKYQQEALKAFGSKIVSEYGAAEAGIIAFECPAGSMHTNMETCIVEVESGEILLTNLMSHSFPIIRYRLGDQIDYDEDAYCACGMQHKLIREVTGRIGKNIYGLSRSYPSLTLYYVFKNLARDKQLVLNYQGVQEKKGTIQLNIEETLTEDTKLTLKEACKQYFSDDLIIVLRDRMDLRTAGRKRRDFISTIDDD